jgi:hypothetical protein
MRIGIWAAVVAVVTGFTAAPVLADDWTAVKLRGTVMEFVDGQWQPLERGDVVPDARLIKTNNTARVTFARGEELIELGPSTQIQILDEGGERPFTTVRQHVGTVEIEAEVQNVQHFAVATPYLVAVVKGTRFVVTSTSRGSKVSVNRGAVSVVGIESATETLISAGQSAATRGSAPLRVSGAGDLPEVVAVDAEGAEELGVDPGNGNGNGNGGNGLGLGLGDGNGLGVSLGVDNGQSNGNGNDQGNGDGADVEVNVGNDVNVGVDVGGNGVNVGVSLGGLSIGLGLGG